MILTVFSFLFAILSSYTWSNDVDERYFVPVYILAGQSNANLAGMDRVIVNSIIASDGAAEFVKVAVNGSQLIADPDKLDWDPDSGELFLDLELAMSRAIENVISQGYKPTLHILWVQGEGQHSLMEQYAAKLNQFITKLENDFAEFPLQFVISLSPSNPLTHTAQLLVISQKPEVLSVEVQNPGYWDDGVHLDRPTREGIALGFLELIPPPSHTETDYTRLEPAWGIEYLPDHDVVIGFAYTDFTHQYVGAKAQEVYSFSGDDNIRTGSGCDTIFSGGNDDLVFSGDGSDYLSGEAHEDELHGEGGNDVILGGLGSDMIFGGKGNDNLFGGSQNDAIYGEDGEDILHGDQGDDLLDGGAGEDTASYSTATSAIIVALYLQEAQNTGSAGVDTLMSIENLVGSDFADTLRGTIGNNRLSGGKGNDHIYAFAGDDRIDGGRRQ